MNTIILLCLILIAAVSISYYINKEGFTDISSMLTTKDEAKKNVAAAMDAIAANEKAIDDKAVAADRIESDTQTLAGAAASPSRTDIDPDISISKNCQDARLLQQKSEMLKDIQKVVRNEILANRNTTPVMDDNSCNSGCDNKNDTNTNTTAVVQGKEYASRCHKDKTCSQQPDMTQYIKKNSIPCWGCSLDY